MIITSLKLENFAGTKERTINFDEALTILKGANESGKTTVANAITFLLADKNLDGSQAKNIRPHDAAGKDVDHIVTSVELSTKEGYTFRKEQRQKWTKKRGTDELVYGGLQNFYFVNGVEKRETDFKTFVEGIAPLDAILYGISAKAFTALDTKKRREKLVPLAEVTDAEVIATDEGFKEIEPLLAVGTVSEIVTGCNRAIKGYASRRKEIPTRIDELSRTARTYKDGDSQEEVKRLEEKAVIARGDIATFDKEIEYLAKANEDAIAAEFDLVQIKNKLTADYQAKKEALDRKIRAAQGDKARYEDSLRNAQFDLRGSIERRDNAFGGVEKCKANIEKIESETFSYKEYNPSEYVEPVEEVCPHCGRPYDAESIKVAKARAEEAGYEKYKGNRNVKKKIFEANKKSAIAKEQSALDYFQNALKRDNDEVEVADQVVTTYRDQLATVNKTLTTLTTERNALVEPDVEADAEVIAMKAELDRLHGDVAKSKELSDKRYEAQNILDNLRRNKESMVERMSSVDSYNKQLENRKAELEAELADLTAKEMAETRKRDLVKAFELAKIKAVTDKLNSRFKYVKWQMFAEQVNGGYADVCIPTVEGTSYDGLLNHGNKLLAELDIALAFQNFYGVKLPLILDDAESVDVERIPKVDRQLIVLRREGEKGTPLTVEVGKWE